MFVTFLAVIIIAISKDKFKKNHPSYSCEWFVAFLADFRSLYLKLNVVISMQKIILHIKMYLRIQITLEQSATKKLLPGKNNFSKK